MNIIDKLNYDIFENIIFFLDKPDIHTVLLINKFFNSFSNNKTISQLILLFKIQNWFHVKFFHEMELIGIVIWSKQFIDILKKKDIYTLKNIFNKNYNANIIEENLNKIIVKKKYVYRKTNRHYFITCNSIINICFHDILKII